MITLQQTRHTEIAPYFQSDNIETLFSQYVCEQKPEATSSAAWTPSGIRGAVVTGRNCGLPHIFSYWLSADTPEVARRLLEDLKTHADDDMCLNFPIHYTDVVHQVFPMPVVTQDHLYRLRPSHFCPHASPYPILPLTPELLDRLSYSQDIASKIGSPEKLYEEMPFYGMIADKQIIALGDALVQNDRSAVIQQIYTLPSYRGQGLGSAMVSTIVKHLFQHGKTPLYWVAETNHASIRIVQKLGFEFAMPLGCLE